VVINTFSLKSCFPEFNRIDALRPFGAHFGDCRDEDLGGICRGELPDCAVSARKSPEGEPSGLQALPGSELA
jgi:hypothetical protein